MPKNVNVEVKLDLDEVIDQVRLAYAPEDIFTEDELTRWAEENGFKSKDS